MLAGIDVLEKKKYSENAAPRRWLIRLPRGPVSRRISHSSRVRGDHYFYALCFLGAWLTTPVCRNMRHLKLSCYRNLDVGAGCELSDERFFCWKMLTCHSWDFHRSVFFCWSYHCVIFSMELLQEKIKGGVGEKRKGRKLWNNQSTWETTKWEARALLWVCLSKTSQIIAVISWADGFQGIRGGRGDGGEDLSAFPSLPKCFY